MNPVYHLWSGGCGCCQDYERVEATGQRIAFPSGQIVLEVRTLDRVADPFWVMLDDGNLTGV
jgi:hypothetical protein